MFDKIKGFSLVFMIVLLSLVFVLQFGGSQAEGCTSGGGGGYVAKVYDTVINQGDLYAAYALAGFDRMQPEELEKRGVRQMVLDGLIERTLLAHEARELGFDVSQDEVMAKLAKDGTARLTFRSASNEIPLPVKDEDGNFNGEYAKRYIQNGLRRGIGEFAESQVDELLAERVRTLVRSSVSVSDAEAWQAYTDDNDKAQIDYVRFSPRFYEKARELNEASVRRWRSENQTKIDADYQANLHKYTGLEEAVRSRHILIKVDADADADDETKEAARKKADALLKKLNAGASFSELAKKHSEDEGSASKGGDLGFNTRGTMVKSFDDAQFALDTGKISDLIESKFGFHIIKVEEKRDGDIPREIADMEIAKRLATQELSTGQAQKAADALLKQWRAGKSTEAIEKQLNAAAKNASETKKAIAPTMAESRLFGWGNNPIPGLSSGLVVASALELAEGESFPGSPIKAGNEVVVFRIKERQRPSKEDFSDEVRLQQIQSLREQKGGEATQQHIAALRENAIKDQAILLPAPPPSSPQS